MARSRVGTITKCEQARLKAHNIDWFVSRVRLAERRRKSLIRVGCVLTGDGSAGSSESHRLTLHSLIEDTYKVLIASLVVRN